MGPNASAGDGGRGAGILFLAVLLAAPAGCDYLEKHKIESALELRARDLAAADAGAYLTLFAPDYFDEWMPFEKMRDEAKKRLSRPPPPKFSFGPRDIIVKGDKALVTERFTLEDTVQGRVHRYDEVQHLRFERRPKGWACYRGSEVLRLLGGRIEEEDAIEQTLLRREAALAKGDLQSYLGLVSPLYQHQGEGPEQIKNKVMQNFQVYDRIRFKSYDRRIWFFGFTATVQQRFNLEATQLGEPVSFSGQERFELEKTRDGWKFTKGL